MRTLSGLGVSAGVGQAHALVVSPAPGLPASDPSRGAEADLAKVEAALGKVAAVSYTHLTLPTNREV